jgi:hypothetical protein
MTTAVPPCRTITVFTFRGDHSRPFASRFQQLLSDDKNGRGTGPTTEECLLFAGHAGVSIDNGGTIDGFNPDGAGIAIWELMDRLRYGEAFPGVVRDDRGVFDTARSRGLTILSFQIRVPDPRFQTFAATLDGERRKSQYSYGFPNGDGDCNCITWLERLGLPLLTGRMSEFATMPGITVHRSRRFGRCV